MINNLKKILHKFFKYIFFIFNFILFIVISIFNLYILFYIYSFIIELNLVLHFNNDIIYVEKNIINNLIVDLDLNKSANQMYDQKDFSTNGFYFKYYLLNFLNFYISVLHPSISLIKIGNEYYVNFIFLDTRGLVNYLVENNYIKRTVIDSYFLSEVSFPKTEKNIEEQAKLDARDKANRNKMIFLCCYLTIIYYAVTTKWTWSWWWW